MPIFTHFHTPIYTHFIRPYTPTSKHPHAHLHPDIAPRTLTRMQRLTVCKYLSSSRNLQTHTHTQKHTIKHVRVQANTHAHTRAHTHTHAHTCGLLVCRAPRLATCPSWLSRPACSNHSRSENTEFSFTLQTQRVGKWRNWICLEHNSSGKWQGAYTFNMRLCKREGGECMHCVPVHVCVCMRVECVNSTICV